MSIRCIVLGVLALAHLALCPRILAQADAGPEAAGRWGDEPRQAVIIKFEGMISPLLEQFTYRKLERARELGADLVILEIDSPGGYLLASKNLAERLRDLDWADTVAYIPREALSGAAIVALGCDRIVMGPNARIGDAGPIVEGTDSKFQYAPAKVVSELSRFVRDLSEAHGRPPALAEAMVDKDLEVFHVHHAQTGEKRLMSDAELEAAGDDSPWVKDKQVLESREGVYLDINGKQAVELGLAESLAADTGGMLADLGLEQLPPVLKPTAVDWAIQILNSPWVTGLLFLIGLVALFVEFSVPGVGLGGLISLLCFTLFFWSRFLGGTSGWLEVLLFLAGLTFLGVEIFLFPGFGVAGVTGLLLCVCSVGMASLEGHLPDTRRALETAGAAVGVFLAAGGVGVVLLVMLGSRFGKLPVFRHLVLAPPASASEEPVAMDEAGKPLKTAADGSHPRVQVGDWGQADTPLRPAGRVAFGDDFLDVVADGTYVAAGQPVRVVRIEGNRIVVREVREHA